MWVCPTSSNIDHAIRIFKYETERSGKNAKTFLEGFKGYLHTDADAYSGYGKVKDIHHYIPKRPQNL